MLEARRLEVVEPLFGLQAAGRLMTEVLAPWVQDLGLLVELVEAGRPPGAAPTGSRAPCCGCRSRRRSAATAAWSAARRSPHSPIAAMVIACAAAWNGYKPMAPIDQTMHFLRPVNFDVVADARVVRIGRTTSFGRVMLYSAADKRPVGMVASAYATV